MIEASYILLNRQEKQVAHRYLLFTLSQVLDRETVSWVCIVGAAPVAAAGFFQYNGLTLERFLWAWLKSEVIMAGKRVWQAENYYEEAMKREVKKH